MKNRLLATLVGTLFYLIGYAQVDTVYLERFDAPSGPDSVSTYNTNSTLTSAWNDTNQFSVSPTMSYHTRIVPFDSVIFETNNFSTVGNIFVRLKFNQICKIHFGQRGILQASNDGGATWQAITAGMYQGNSPQFGATGYFNELSYPSQNQTPYWHGPTTTPGGIVTPTNQWWAEETFDVSSILGGVNGYPNCKIRFIASHQISVPISLAGWYVDNVLVEAAPCELEPPKFTYNVTQFRKPDGARYNPSQEVRIRAIDVQSGIDSVLIHYKLNSGPWQVTPMVPAITASCPDSSLYTHNFTNIALYDTIRWYVEIFDCACPNLTRDPIATALPNYYKFWRADAPPPICGTAYPNSFPLVVTTFPYKEGFENTTYWNAGSGDGLTGTSHRGTWPVDNTPNGLNWTVTPGATQTGFAWSIRANGGTATANTGPSAGNNNSNQYLYTEASQGNGASTPQFTTAITPCINLGVINCAALEFYYHMYGTNTDKIRVDVDTGHTTSSWVIGVASLDGQQHTSSSAPYTKAFVSLEQFAGKIIRIRFIGRKNTATAADKNDMAIDDISIFEPKPVDVEMTNYFEPQNGFCSYSNAEVVKGKMQSLGCVTLSEIPVAFRYELTPPTGPVVNTIKRDTIYGNFPLSSDTAFSFAPTADLSQYGTYRLWIWSEVPGDTVNGNDTVGPYIIEHLQPIGSFPYILDFDGPQTTPGNGTNTNPGVTGTDDWERIPDPTTFNYAFHVMTGKTPSAATGPRYDYTNAQDGNYLYAEGNYGTAAVNNAIFQSECINLTGLTTPVLDFMYHAYGADIGALIVQVVPAGSNSWTTIPGAAISAAAQKQTASTDQWRYFSANLSNYVGQTVKFRFIAQKTGAGSSADIAIDNIRIYNKISTDVGIIDINGFGRRIDVANPVSPKFLIRNFGTAAVTGVPINYTITPLCGPNAGVSQSYTTTYSGTIAAGQDFLYTVPASAMPTYPDGDFEICATTNKSGDSQSFNDSYCVRSVLWPTFFIQTGFNEDFDACNDGTEKGFFSAGNYWTFELGSTTSSSAPNSYNSTAFPYTSYPNTDEYLFAPKFIGFDTIVGAQLWFSHNFNFGANDAGVVEFFAGTWKPLGFNDPTDQIGINWYNGANLNQIGNGDGFSSTSTSYPGNTNGWITSMWPLNIYNNSSNALVLRWHQFNAGGGATGWAIDNVEIRIPPQNSASPFVFDTEQYLIFPHQPTDIKVRIQNTGAKRLDSCMVSYQIDAGAWSTPEKVVFDPSLVSNGRSDWYTFNAQWNNPTSGTHDICIVTSRPNNKQDNFTQDDTLCGTLKVLDEIFFTPTDTVYCNNFDDPSQVDWIELNTDVKTGLVSWEKGTPAQAPITGAHSAPNAWMTKLNNNYKTRDSSSLHTPVFVSDSGSVFDIEFWHNFKTEKYHDGGTVDISFDGVTWRTVGYVLPDSSWFTTTYVTALDVLDPGWTGESNGWVKANIKIQFDQDRRSVFRFRFASDQSFEYQGWAIDDFCMRASTGTPDDFIGIDELDQTDFIDVGNIIPNPTNGQTIIPYFLNSPADLKVSIYNTIGQQMLETVKQGESGVSNLEFDVTGWSPGLYIVSIEVNGTQVTRKMMVN